MKLEQSEIEELARALAPLVASQLEQRLSDRPEWCFSISEAAAWLAVPEHCIRDAIADGRLPAVRIGRQIRVKRSDLFSVRGGGGSDADP